nr:hypothetical protein GTC16762_31510 [Pigmentibacter ruber]
MTIEEVNTSKIDPRIQFRCSSIEEREFFQNEINRSGMKPQQYFKAAVEAFKMQTLPEESEQKKALAEVDILTNRLNQLNRSQLLIAFEMQEQAKKELQELNRERGEFEEYKKGLEGKLQEEFERKNQELEAKFTDLVLQNKEKQRFELEAKEKEILSLRDIIENQEAKMNQLLSDLAILKKQLEDKNKLNSAYEEREFEAKKKIMELEERLKKAELNALSIQKLEIDKAVLLEKLESIKKEEALKRENIELKLKHFHLTEKTNGDDYIYKNLESRERKIDDEQMLNAHKEHSLIDSGAVK